MNAKIITALACAVIAATALAGCSASGTGSAGGTATPTSTPPSVVTAHGTGSTVGSKTGSAPTTVTVPLPAGTHGIDVSVSCPGSQQVIVTDESSSSNRYGTCGQSGPILVPISATGPTASLDVLAFTGGRPFTVRAVATTTEFHQDAALVTVCKTYSAAYSTLFNADLSYQKNLSTAQQWAGSRSAGSAQLEQLASDSSTPAWASEAVTSIRTAALAAAPGKAATADGADTQVVAIRCDDNSSGVSVDVSVPGEG